MVEALVGFRGLNLMTLSNAGSILDGGSHSQLGCASEGDYVELGNTLTAAR